MTTALEVFDFIDDGIDFLHFFDVQVLLLMEHSISASLG